MRGGIEGTGECGPVWRAQSKSAAAAQHWFCIVSKINHLIVRGPDRLYFSPCLNHVLLAPFSSFISLYYWESVETLVINKPFFAWLRGSKKARGVMWVTQCVSVGPAVYQSLFNTLQVVFLFKFPLYWLKKWLVFTLASNKEEQTFFGLKAVQLQTEWVNTGGINWPTTHTHTHLSLPCKGPCTASSGTWYQHCRHIAPHIPAPLGTRCCGWPGWSACAAGP